MTKWQTSTINVPSKVLKVKLKILITLQTTMLAHAHAHQW
jgi:hypothetical protein